MDVDSPTQQRNEDGEQQQLPEGQLPTRLDMKSRKDREERLKALYDLLRKMDESAMPIVRSFVLYFFLLS